MSIFTEKPYRTGVLLGLAGFGIALYTTPVVLQFAATIGSYMSSFIGAVPALFAGLALTAGLCILAGVAAALIAVAIARCFPGAPKEPTNLPSNGDEQEGDEDAISLSKGRH